MVFLPKAYDSAMSEHEKDSVNPQRASVKLFWGILLLFLTPVFLFVKPVTSAAVLRDLLLVIWWAFIFWLLLPVRKNRGGRIQSSGNSTAEESPLSIGPNGYAPKQISGIFSSIQSF